MKTNSNLAVRIKIMSVAATCAMSILATRADAQVGAGGASPQGAQAVQLPLSGRAGQNGSVNSTETPAPGATTSVNTLNPAVQVQGPFTGSANSVAAMPFSGHLSFGEALQRGLVYNLGAVGLAQAVRQARGAEPGHAQRLAPQFEWIAIRKLFDRKLEGARLSLFLSRLFSSHDRRTIQLF